MIYTENQKHGVAHCKRITWCTIPEPGGTTSMFWKAVDPHLRKANLSLFLWNSSSIFACTAFSDRATSTWTEWSITRSTGTWETLTNVRKIQKPKPKHIATKENWKKYQRVDFVGITAEFVHSITHTSKVNNSGDSSKVLKKNTSWLERNLDLFRSSLFPVDNLLNIFLGDLEVITVTNRGFKKNPDRVRQFIYKTAIMKLDHS